MENCYVYLFNKECLKDKVYDQESKDIGFEDDILLYSTINPKKLGEKLQEHFSMHPKSKLIIYVITDLMIEYNVKGIFPHSNENNVTSVYSFIQNCLSEVLPLPNNNKDDVELEISVYSIAISTPYNNGHIPDAFYDISDEKAMLQVEFDKFADLGLKKLFIKNYYVDYKEDNVNNATDELLNLKNKLMLQKDKPEYVIDNSSFIKENTIIFTDKITLNAK